MEREFAMRESKKMSSPKREEHERSVRKER